MPSQIVVAGALIADRRLLVAQRTAPPELAGRWELPGGKVAAAETEPEALTRELREELGIVVRVGHRLGRDVAIDNSTTLRAYLVTSTGGPVRPTWHRAVRWLRAAELAGLDWVPADRAWLPDLSRALGAGGGAPTGDTRLG